MGMAINTNLSAMNAQRNLGNTQNDLSKSLEKLSSGLRINRAADDAAGLSISEGLRSQSNGYGVAARNAQDGISVIQTAEGGLTETHSILQRMRDLAVQAGNDSNNENGRDAIAEEVKQLTSELGRIAESTNFNGIKLLDGSRSSLTFQVGADGSPKSGGQLDVNLGGANVAKIANTLTGGNLGATGSSFTVDFAALTTGAQSFTSTTSSGVSTAVTTAVLKDTADGSAVAFQSVEEYANALKADSNFAAHFEVAVARDDNGAGTGIVVSARDGGIVQIATPPGTGVVGAVQASAPLPGGLNFDNAINARASIEVLDDQIKTVSAARSDLGAMQNRFESSINSLNVGRENLTAAESRIRDVDMAAEMVKFTKANILSQAGTSMLAQANQSGQGILSLLR